MNIQTIFTQLKCPYTEEAEKAFLPFWYETADGNNELADAQLEESRIRWCIEQAAIAPSYLNQALWLLHEIKKNDALYLYYCHLFRLLFLHPQLPMGAETAWPFPGVFPPSLRGPWDLFLILGAVPFIIESHRERGINQEITSATLSDISVKMKIFFRTNNGETGLPPKHLHWFRNHVQNHLLKIGRLQFVPIRAIDPVEAYRSKKTGEVILIFSEPVRLDRRGLIDGLGGTFDEQGFTTQKSVSANEITANVCDAEGFVSRDLRTLSLSEWECLQKKGDWVLEMHIPEEGPMVPSECMDAMKRANSLFRVHFPEYNLKGFRCRSWIFNPDLPRIHRADTNMVIWKRMLHPFPVNSTGRDGIKFLFDSEEVDLKEVVCTSKLQKAFADVVLGGEKLYSGGVLYLNEELEY